jgi:glycosyltransferase involved in cell wall biosynthesis
VPIVIWSSKTGQRVSPLVTVDARMLRATGIGSYLRGVLPRVVARLETARFCLLGDPAELEREAVSRSPRVEVRAFGSKIYGPSEQPGLFWRTPRETRLFWAPHVNAPLVGPGRLVVTVHDAFYANPPAGARPRWDKALYLSAMLRGLRRRADAVLCDSAFTRAELERHLGRFSCPLHVVPIGIDAAWFERPAPAVTDGAPYLVFVGNLKPHKNLARTLAAFASIAERVPHAFVIVGPGDGAELARGLRAGVAGRVRFVGKVDDAELKRYVAGASGLVLASLYEGFGLPPLEAMALGVPVLVSRAASLPEVCGDAALYCDPESVPDIARGLVTLLSDEAERARLSAAGPERARTFDWERCSEATSAVLAEVLAVK